MTVRLFMGSLAAQRARFVQFKLFVPLLDSDVLVRERLLRELAPRPYRLSIAGRDECVAPVGRPPRPKLFERRRP